MHTQPKTLATQHFSTGDQTINPYKPILQSLSNFDTNIFTLEPKSKSIGMTAELNSHSNVDPRCAHETPIPQSSTKEVVVNPSPSSDTNFSMEMWANWLLGTIEFNPHASVDPT